MRKVPLRCFLFLLALSPAMAVSLRAQSAVGDVAFPNSGAPAAQADFLHGLAQLHNFEFEVAAAAFAKAQKIDPNFALAYWGEAMTHNHPLWAQQDLEAARGVLKKLAATPEARLVKAKTDREKDFVRAAEILYGDGAKFERDFRYADFMAQLHAKYPGDIETSCFYALALLGTAHNGRDIPTYMRAAALLQDVFYAHPHHPGAAHYLIHSYDDPVHAPLGLPAARAYSQIAPEAGHAQHMTSHIFLSLGMWDDVVRANEQAMAVVNRQRAAAGKPPTFCGHYNIWLEYAYLEQGRFADAKQLLALCRDQAAGEPAAEHHGTAMASASFVEMRGHYLVNTQDWPGEVSRWSVSAGAGLPEQFAQTYVTALAAVRGGDADRAKETLRELEQLAGKLKEDIDKRDYRAEDSDRAIPGIEIQQIRALLLAHDGKKDEAVLFLQKASQDEGKLPFSFGPPAIAKPSAELLGELLLELQRPADARKAFEESLAHTPQRVASLLGLARTQALLGDRAAAEQTEAMLRLILRHADHPPADLRSSRQ